MYQRIDFTKEGGYPLTQNDMSFLQNSYNLLFGAIARNLGDFLIMSGVTATAPNTYSAGWIAINGEILPFSGGVNLGDIVVTQTSVTKTFSDGSINQVLFTRVASFGNSGGGIAFTSFKRITLETLSSSLTTLQNTVNNLQTTVNNLVSGSVPTGTIAMWAGTTPPAGWQLCDGLDGRPNLKGRFIAGYDAGDADYDAIGDNGGAKTVTLNITQMPYHGHGMLSAGGHTHGLPGGDLFAVWSGNEADAGSGSSGNEIDATGASATTTNGSHTHTILSEGGSGGVTQAHENRPPYYTLAYIIKV
jgi:microcystin-dependent protein